VDQTLLAPAREAPAEADLAFERMYRSNRDDVYAYLAGLLRDRSAAEEVTAAVFERAFRKRRHFDARRGSSCSASPATPRSMSYAVGAVRQS
jgi:DNA-directed RNA polymerase specialized sigma24 family protein